MNNVEKTYFELKELVETIRDDFDNIDDFISSLSTTERNCYRGIVRLINELNEGEV
jgi:hypothetical protein